MRRALYGNPRISSTHGERTNLGSFGRHLGYDYAVSNQPVVAPEDMIVIGLYHGGSGGNYIEARGKYTHRFLHLSRHSVWRRFNVRVGQLIKEGTVFAKTGNTGFTTGPHLHHDTRRNGTAWNSSFANYVDWEKLIKKPVFKMPKVGSKIQLIPTDLRTTFRNGTTTRAGAIRVTNNTFIYTVRGYDKKYPNRILINSRSAGGDGVSLALFYTNGVKIPKWKQL